MAASIGSGVKCRFDRDRKPALAGYVHPVQSHPGTGPVQEITEQRRNRIFRYGPYLALFQDDEGPKAAAEA
jgi:hypothetical protein